MIRSNRSFLFLQRSLISVALAVLTGVMITLSPSLAFLVAPALAGATLAVIAINLRAVFPEDYNWAERSFGYVA